MTCGDTDLGCSRCGLCRTRGKVVRGVGPCDARLVFIGEAPGRDEDAAGTPFVGRAGKVLDDALAHAGVDRGSVYITNLVKCRPPGNRRPKSEEVDACSAHLASELARIGPAVICLLGQTVAKNILGDESKMSAIVEEPRTVEVHGQRVTAFVAYHPAACLYRRENVESLRRTIRSCAEAAGLL